MLGYHSPPDQAHPPPQAGTPEQTPPRPGTPLGSRPPPAQCMLGDTVNKRAVYILLECNLVKLIFEYVYLSFVVGCFYYYKCVQI